MKAVGIFGGTFDPIHNGHLLTALSVKEARDLDKIIFMPAFISPHKTEKQHSDPVHRLEMVKLAVKGVSYFDVSDYEINKKDVSYTIDTIKELKKSYSSIELIIGYDNLLVFDTWKDPGQIFNMAKVIVLKRGSDDAKKRNKYFDKAIFAETPVIEISSTAVRERVKNNLPIDFFVTGKVKEYIYKHNLYKEV
ncbi:MAG: nicotinate-nucleotide adenylyltransferase [Ignavibacteriaceae bacterium]